MFNFDYLQVFFSIITAVFSLGQAAPHFQELAQARGAAYTLWNIIDTVNKNKSINFQYEYLLYLANNNFNK